MRIKVREINYFLGWLVFWLAASVSGGIIGGVVGGILGAVLGGAGVDLRVIRLIAVVAGMVVSLPVSYGFFRLIVGWLVVGKAEVVEGS